MVLVSASAWAQVPPDATPQSPRAILDSAESALQQLQFRQAIKLLTPLVEERTLPFEAVEDEHHAYELLGAAHWYLDEFDTARLHWTALLIKRPAYELDKLVYPKPMRDGFQRTRTQLLKQGIIQEVPQAVPDTESPPTILRITEYKQLNSRAMTFMPFGLAQYDQGADSWGTFFATSQGAAALTHIASGITMWTLSYQGKLNDGNYDALLGTVVGSLATWTVLTVWGIIDANVRHQPERIVRIERTIQTQEAADIRTPQPQRMKPAPTAGGSR
jgi:hypothetical protein